MILDGLLTEFGVAGLSEGEIDHLNRVWHRLTPWPDVVAGLERLRRRFVVATLSNGNVALLTNMAKNAGLTWDCVLSAELAKRYKPDPEVYQMAADLLGLRPYQVLMVAAHKHDLRGAQGAGMKTAFVPRPLEFGPERHVDITPDPSFDLHAADFEDLAGQAPGLRLEWPGLLATLTAIATTSSTFATEDSHRQRSYRRHPNQRGPVGHGRGHPPGGHSRR